MLIVGTNTKIKEISYFVKRVSKAIFLSESKHPGTHGASNVILLGDCTVTEGDGPFFIEEEWAVLRRNDDETMWVAELKWVSRTVQEYSDWVDKECPSST